ncbi:hypothetical protein B4Q04_00730 [Zobellia sp. OII3]|uniref:glycosyltransferase n=1 Tax=Zobellia sp. OII3 TaxID=2034520 RepID=UPI000B53817E|nr:glycosyltransferase [Zobellia sp. OII3]OWW26242.1 hypothetical protein B4Q04_00730 [Zobellia sp. OII3]
MNSQAQNLSPIALFAYNRIEELAQTIDRLKKAQLASKSLLYVFSDGPKTLEDQKGVEKVRSYLKTVTGFQKVELRFSEKNKGLAHSIITGVSGVLKEHGKIIVLEDDLLVSDNFLVFMNQGLEYYRENPRILSICGYNMGVRKRKSDEYRYDAFFAQRSSSWGWATWDDQWQGIDWEIRDFDSFSKNRKKIREFNIYGSDLFRMLKRQKEGKINSWAIRYNYHQYKHDLYSVFPLISKVRNIGFSEQATHTNQKYNRFDVELDDTSENNFTFQECIAVDAEILKQFSSMNSITNRIKFKIKNLF